jgi:DNA-binding NarL/FixJ family response regulator
MQKKLSVLVVDDSPVISNRLKNLLGELKFVRYAGHAENYNDALVFIDALKTDVILLDINLRGKSGIEVLIKVKKNYPHIKVIMFTNNVDHHYREICARHGADYFLDKSNEFDRIEETLKKIYDEIGK